MKKIFFLFCFFISLCAVKAQESSVGEIQNEFVPSMSGSQRTALVTFEFLRVIDTDDKRTWIYKNGKWQREFSDEAIQQAKNLKDERLKNNESWKLFDELSKPETGNVSTSSISSVENSNINKNTSIKNALRYITLKSNEIPLSKILLEASPSEKVAFIKIYLNDASEVDINGFPHFSFKETNSILIQPHGIDNGKLSFSLIKKNQNTLLEDYTSIKGMLIAFADTK